MPLGQNQYDAGRASHTEALPAVHADPRVNHFYTLLGQARRALNDAAEVVAHLNHENQVLRSRLGETHVGEQEDLFRGLVG